MLRPNILNIWNKNNPITLFDEWLANFGGTVFLRAYTPGPDTPRSQAAMWSSRYPKFNGCNTRLKYPQYNLLNPQNNYLRLLINEGYQLNVHISESTKILGELPEAFDGECNYSNDLLVEDYLRNLVIENNSLTYLFFDDFHYAVDDYRSREGASTFGINQIMKWIKTIDNTISIHSFDLVLMHSDHGFKKYGENLISPYDWIGEKRSNVFMFLHQKGDTRIEIDKQIRSVMDIGPTICELIGVRIPYQIDGKTLLDKKGLDYLVVSDHKSFDVGLSVPVVFWGIYTNQGFAAIDCNENWIADYELSDEMKDKLYGIISQYGDYFNENVLATRIRHYYDQYMVSPHTYFDGEPRRVHYTFKERIKIVVKKLLGPLVFVSKIIIQRFG